MADHGFPSLNMFAHAKEKGIFFLVRAKDLYIERLLCVDFPNDRKEFDVTASRIVTRLKAIAKRSLPDSPKIYRYVDRNTKFDYMESGSSNEYPLSLRVVRVEIEEGVYENLITNIPTDEFDMDALRIL